MSDRKQRRERIPSDSPPSKRKKVTSLSDDRQRPCSSKTSQLCEDSTFDDELEEVSRFKGN